jgi:predicted HicB family RNase H-like nuclease
MGNLLIFNKYQAEYAYSLEDRVYYGKLVGIDDLVAFEGETPEELVRSSHATVFEYQETLHSLGKDC